MAKYKLTGKDSATGEDNNTLLLHKDDDGNALNPVLQIPKDPNNKDYAEYLEWAKTNTPEAAD